MRILRGNRNFSIKWTQACLFYLSCCDCWSIRMNFSLLHGWIVYLYVFSSWLKIIMNLAMILLVSFSFIFHLSSRYIRWCCSCLLSVFLLGYLFASICFLGKYHLVRNFLGWSMSSWRRKEKLKRVRLLMCGRGCWRNRFILSI